jgi:hypothetical protein
MKRHGRVSLICLLGVVQAVAGLAGQGTGRLLYTAPSGTFIEDPDGDRVVTVNDGSGSIATLQASIDRAHSANPDAFVVVRLARGTTYSVTSASLVLDSRESLVAEGAVFRAASPSVTVPLIRIASGATKVSVAGATLDGNGANIRGIDVTAASRVNIDRVKVRNCRQDGIRLNGQGNTVFNNEMTVTRSEISGSGGAGIRVQNATQTVLIDNHVHDNGVGIHLAGAWASAVNNTCRRNGTGIETAGSDNIVGNNTCTENATGIRAAGTKAMVVSNLLGGNTTAGMASAGTSNNFIDNRFAAGNATSFTSAGSGNNIIAYKAPLNAPGQNYFYPPLIDDPHTRPLVNGMGRTDVTVGSGTIDTVQSRYDAARAANPNNAIVLRLNGTFTVGATPLTLSSNTAVLLNGTIQLPATATATAVIRTVTGHTRISISGGILDGGNRNDRKGVHVPTGSMVQVDAMTIRNFGDNAEHHRESDSIHFKAGATPLVVTRCNIDKSGARGIWAQTSGQKALYADNTVRNTRSCIDCDSKTFGAVMLFNRCYDNTYGIFIEQAASHNTAIGNVINNSARRNVELYNNNLTPEVRYSTVACNTLVGGGAAIRNGSTPEGGDPTSFNFLFNNVVLDGLVRSELNGEENYYSQNHLAGSSTLTTAGTETFFNSPGVEAHQYIQDGNSGLALTVQGASTAAGAAVVTGGGTGVDEWRLVATEGGHYRIENRRSRLVMAVSGGSTAAGAAVVQRAYTEDAVFDDEWRIQSAGAGLYHVVNRRSGLFLEVTGGGGAGTPLTQRRPTGAAPQRFNLTEDAPRPPAFVDVTPGPGGVAASANDGNLPGNTVDRDLATRWSANGDGQWIQFDLGSSRTVAQVTMAFFAGDTRQARFDLQASGDGTTWTNVLTGATSSGTTVQEQTFDFPDRPARFLRYLGHGNTANAWNSLTEVRILAPASPGVP